MNLWLILVPFAFMAAAFAFGAVVLRYIAKRAKIAMTESQFGKTLHLETPLGSLDMHPQGKLDARLARIPIYPGALRENPEAAESVTELQFGGKTYLEISASYWTPDPADGVREFYRQQLPQWLRNLDGVQGGRELICREKEHALLVRIVKHKDRTVIETCVKPPDWPHPFERNYKASAGTI